MVTRLLYDVIVESLARVLNHLWENLNITSTELLQAPKIKINLEKTRIFQLLEVAHLSFKISLWSEQMYTQIYVKKKNSRAKWKLELDHN